MSRLLHKLKNHQQRKRRVRSTVSGTGARPRLSVFVSNRNVIAQIIDDEKQTTLVAVTTVGNKDVKGNMTTKSDWVGTEIAKQAKTKKIKKVVFDRNGRLYHGRVKALADAARKEGLEF